MTRSTDGTTKETPVVIYGTLRVASAAQEATGGSDDDVLTDEDRLWLDLARKLVEDSTKSLEEGAKQVMTACTFFITVYAFILSEASDRSAMSSETPLLFAAPLVLFSLSMVSAVVALVPFRYRVVLSSITGAEATWSKITRDKSQAVRIAITFLVFGLSAFVATLVVYCLG